MAKQQGQAPDIDTIKKSFPRPQRAVVTAGMPYANGPLHLGHLAGALVPPDIYARWMRMLIGGDNVLFVCGSDDHGSAGELSALKAGKPVRQMIDEIHEQQERTLKRFNISVETYSGTSRADCLSVHQDVVQDFYRRLHGNGMFEKRMSKQWFDPQLGRFLQDRFVRGKCPNPKCDNDAAYSDECDRCGMHYAASELIDPRSAISGVVPELRETAHWWLNMWKVGDPLRIWIEGKQGKWRTPTYNEVMTTVSPALRFENMHELRFKELRSTLPKHKTRYAPGKRVVAQFGSMADLQTARVALEAEGISSELVDDWAHRSVTRDVAWGIPVQPEIDPDMVGKTVYVWPESLIAPISFSRLALAKRGQNPERYAEFWRNPEARICQFLGQDNVYFYVLMQGAMWIGTQADTTRLPVAGEYQLTDVFGCCLLTVGGEKMSKSRGNFFTGDQLLDERGYSADQIRYFLALLGLPETSSNFDFQALDDRNKFLAGPMNAAFEKPISACHSKFGGKVPAGVLNEKVVAETRSLIQKYLRAMDRSEHTALLGAIENYARQINSMFTQFKPHDDRFPEDQRRDALYSCFFVLKNIMIMLYPFVPDTMNKVRESLRLPDSVFCIDELGTPIPAGHKIGEKQQFFPACG